MPVLILWKNLFLIWCDVVWKLYTKCNISRNIFTYLILLQAQCTLREITCELVMWQLLFTQPFLNYKLVVAPSSANPSLCEGVEDQRQLLVNPTVMIIWRFRLESQMWLDMMLAISPPWELLAMPQSLNHTSTGSSMATVGFLFDHPGCWDAPFMVKVHRNRKSGLPWCWWQQSWWTSWAYFQDKGRAASWEVS